MSVRLRASQDAPPRSLVSGAGRPLSWRCAGLLALMALMANGPVRAEPLDLLAVYEAARQNQPALQAAEATVREAVAGRRAAQGLLLPQVSAFGDLATVDERIEGDFFGLRDVRREERFERYRYGLSLRQALVRPALWAGLDQADLRQEQARTLERGVVAALTQDVAHRYFEVLRTAEQLRLADARVSALQRQRDETGSRARAGLLTAAEAQLAEAAYQGARAQRLDAQVEAQLARTRLRQLTGASPRQLRDLATDFNALLPQPAEPGPWIERALQAHPAVLAQRLALAIADHEREKAQRAHWPTMDVVGSAYELDSRGGLAGRRDEREWRLGLSLQLPLYAGGSLTASATAAEAARDRARAELERVEAEVGQDAELAFLQLMASHQRLAALGSSLEALRAAESATAAGVDAGFRTPAELLRVQEDRYRAEIDYQGMRYLLLLRSLRLRQAAGVLVPADLAGLNRLLDRPVVLAY